MKILLVNPSCRIPALIPLGLGYIASVLRNDGHEIEFLDLNLDKDSCKNHEKALSNKDFDIIGIGGLTTTYTFVKNFSRIAKTLVPKAKIVAGNMVSTAHPELLLNNSHVDICVIDEGEATMIELARKIKDYPNIDTVNGIIFKRDNELIKTKPRDRIQDLDSLPFPAWDLFDMETYINNPIHAEYGRRSMNISTVRGCPFQCIYCSRPFGSRSYMRSSKSIISEIKALKERYKIDFIGFTDDLFILNKSWVMKFCDDLIKEKVKIKWGSSARVNLVDQELLSKMKKAGCEVVSYGFESGSQSILNTMSKGVTVEQAEKAIDMTRKAGITIEGSFMIGMIGETEETINETVDFIKRTGLMQHRFFYTTPYPSTPLYDMAKKMGRIPKDEDRYVASLGEMYSLLLVNLTDMSNERLSDLKAKVEERIKNNFNIRTKLEIIRIEARRVKADIKKRIKKNGLLTTLKWSFKKVKERAAF